MTATGRRQPGIVPVRDTFTRAWKKLPRAAARVSWTDSQPASRVRVYVLIGLSRLNSPFYPPINPLPGTENSEKWFRIVIRFLLTRRDEPRAYIFQPRVRELLTFANTAPAWISAGCINLPPAAFEWIAGGRSRFLVCAKMGSVIHGVIHKYLTRRQRAALVLYQSTHMRARARASPGCGRLIFTPADFAIRPTRPRASETSFYFNDVREVQNESDAISAVS